MQIRQLEIFLAVVRSGSFSKAGEELFLSQPTISAHIRALEQELGEKLFDRSGRNPALTPRGHAMVGYAERITDLYSRAVGASAAEERSSLIIAASSVPAEFILPRVLPRVKEAYPELRLTVRMLETEEALTALRRAEADAAIVGGERPDAHLVSEPLLTERVVLITPDTPVFRAFGGVITKELLLSSPFVLRGSGSGTGKVMERVLSRYGLSGSDLRVSARMWGTRSVMDCVKGGMGISVISGFALDHCESREGLLAFPLEDPTAKRTFYGVTDAVLPPPAAAAFLFREIARLK